MRIVAISDTHLFRPVLPAGDLLVHTGDLTYRGEEKELESVNEYFAFVQPQFKYGIVYIAGNHDFMFQNDPTRAQKILHTGIYLQDEGVEIEGIRFWGTPWVTQFYDWAFMGDEKFLNTAYSVIPKDTDILLCHGPAKGFLDRVERGENVGSTSLLTHLNRVKPAVFIHGHIHDEYGQARLNYKGGESTLIINAAICNDRYKPVHPPVVLDVDDDKLTDDQKHGPVIVVARD